jgi:hypothetical protein
VIPGLLCPGAGTGHAAESTDKSKRNSWAYPDSSADLLEAAAYSAGIQAGKIAQHTVRATAVDQPADQAHRPSATPAARRADWLGTRLPMNWADSRWVIAFA